MKRKYEGQSLLDKLKRNIADAFYSIQVFLSQKLSIEKRKKSISNRRIGDRIFYCVLVALPILQFFFYYVLINFNSFFLAFKSYNASTNSFEWAGFFQFKEVFKNLSIKNTSLNLAFSTSLWLYFVGFLIPPFDLIVSYYIYKKQSGAEFFKVLLYLPKVLSGLVIAMLYQYFVDQVIPDIWLKIFQREVNPLLQTSETRLVTAWIFGIIFGMGGNMLVYIGVMSRVPDSVIEYAQLDGIKPFQEFLFITFPLIFPTWATYFVVGVSGMFSGTLNLYEFFGPNSSTVQTVGYHSLVLVMGSSGYAAYPYATALGLLCTAIALPTTLFARWLTNKLDPEASY